MILLSRWCTPGPAFALDQGGGQLGFSYYYLQCQTLGQKFTFSEPYGFLEAYQHLTNVGLLEGRLAFSHLTTPGTGPGEPQGWQQAYGRLSLKNYRWGKGVMEISAGDQFFPLSTFPIRFTNFFYPDNYFRGLSTRYSHPLFQLMLLGGEVTISRGLLAETFQGMGETFYGMLLRTQPLARWNLENGFFFTQGEKDYTGNLITRHNLVYRLGSQYKVWSQLYLAGEFMQSFSETPAGTEQHDLAYRAGSLWQGERLSLEVNYRNIGPRFHLINQIYQPDRAVKGYYLSGDFRPWPFLGVFGSYDSANANLSSDPSRSLNETMLRTAGLRFYRNPWPSFYCRYYESTLSTRSDFPVAVQGHIKALYSEISHRYKIMEGYFRYEQFQFVDQINGANNYRKEVPLLGVRFYHQKFSWYLEGEYDRFNPVSQGQGFDGPYVKVGGNYFVSQRLSLYGELGYRTKSGRFSGQLGVNWQLPHGFTLNAYGRVEKANTSVGDFLNGYSSNQVTVRLVKAFSWGKKAEVTGLKPGQDWLGAGSIEGWVFNDANLNEALDPGEEGVAGIKLKLEDGSTVTTDARGYYQFPSVAAGKHVVTLESRRIPAAYTFLGAETMAVAVQRRAKARADFPFVKGASIRGRVLEDPKGTGKATPDAKGLPDVLVLLKPGDLNTYTDREGYFFFEGVLPKRYEIGLAPESLPQYAEITSPKTLTATLRPGGQAHGLVFLVQPPKRPIIFK